MLQNITYNIIESIQIMLFYSRDKGIAMVPLGKELDLESFKQSVATLRRI